MTTNPTNVRDTESGLSVCLRDNDPRVFSRLYDQFSGSVFGLILKWVNDYEVAENLLQDVFMKAWRCRHLYDESKGRIFTWLYNIARNIAIDYLRSRAYKRRKVSLLKDDVEQVSGVVKCACLPTDTIGLRQLVRNLKKDEQEVVELMYFKGFTQREVAEMMNIPIGTVKTKMRKAISRLRKFFLNDLEKGIGHISLN